MVYWQTGLYYYYVFYLLKFYKATVLFGQRYGVFFIVLTLFFLFITLFLMDAKSNLK